MWKAGTCSCTGVADVASARTLCFVHGCSFDVYNGFVAVSVADAAMYMFLTEAHTSAERQGWHVWVCLL